MKPYRTLTRLGQLRRMRKLAAAALERYQLGGAQLRFLRYFANITYRVDVPGMSAPGDYSGPYRPGRYLLRVLASDHWDYALGEMTWLAALSGKAGLPVPGPVPTPEGELLARVHTPGIPAGRIVSLMRWVDGRKRTARLRLDQFKAWGQLVGRLHAFAAGWQPPADFQRYVWDWEGLLGGRGFSCRLAELVDSMPGHLQEPFQVVSAQAREVMAALGKSPGAFGMVHGDMYAENILFKGEQVIPIDFEDCGFGYWLWDMAVALEADPWTDGWYRQRDAFLNGYTQVHSLPDTQLCHLDLFLAIDYATGVLWGTAFMRDDPGRESEHAAWRHENGVKLLRYFEGNRGV
jgi:Ser/Thr protein kinase RdoA (MazF antagonist)